VRVKHGFEDIGSDWRIFDVAGVASAPTEGAARGSRVAARVSVGESEFGAPGKAWVRRKHEKELKLH
jgi:hypothetical protein